MIHWPKFNFSNLQRLHSRYFFRVTTVNQEKKSGELKVNPNTQWLTTINHLFIKSSTIIHYFIYCGLSWFIVDILSSMNRPDFVNCDSSCQSELDNDKKSRTQHPQIARCPPFCSQLCDKLSCWSLHALAALLISYFLEQQFHTIIRLPLFTDQS